MECDSGTEAVEGELEVVSLAEPATPSFTEPESDHRPTNIVKAISFFLFFFQLKYRVSDRAISLLLLFIKGLVQAVISLVPSCASAVSVIYQSIPQYLKSLRQTFTSGMNGVTEYVVCPKCSTLYEASECSMVSHDVYTYF